MSTSRSRDIEVFISAVFLSIVLLFITVTLFNNKRRIEALEKEVESIRIENATMTTGYISHSNRFKEIDGVLNSFMMHLREDKRYTPDLYKKSHEHKNNDKAMPLKP